MWEWMHGEDETESSVYCPHFGRHGISRDESFLADAWQVVQLPEVLGFVETASLMCAGLTIIDAPKPYNLFSGYTVRINGYGDNLGGSFAIEMGCNVVGIVHADAALQLAKRCTECSLRSKSGQMTPHRNTETVVPTLPNPTGASSPSERSAFAILILTDSQAASSSGTYVVVFFWYKGFNISAKRTVFKDIGIMGSSEKSNRGVKEMLHVAAKAKYSIHRLSRG